MSEKLQPVGGQGVEIVPARKRHGEVTGLFSALKTGFQTAPVSQLALTHEGIEGDRHGGLLRKSNAREPWYEKGTEMRNEQQISLLDADELAAVARDMDIDRLEPEWIGCNILLKGIPRFSLLPPRTLLMFEGGVTIRVDGDRGPCRISGRSIASRFEGRQDLEFAFPKTAKYRRGLVGWVEVAGTLERGEKVVARIWEQCIYPG